MTKRTHGGKRIPGPGKKLGPAKNPYPLRILKIACTEDELKAILAQIPDTRKRAEILLTSANERKESGNGNNSTQSRQ